MKRKSKASVAILSAAISGLMCAPTVKAAVVTWVGAVGTPLDYGTGANWSGGNVPGAGDQAEVTNGGTAVISSGSFNSAEIWAGNNVSPSKGNIIQTGGTLTANGWLVIGRFQSEGTYNFSGGTINELNNGRVQLDGNIGAGIEKTVLTVGTGATLNAAGIVDIGDHAASVIVNGGSINATNELWVGQGGTGHALFQLNSGTVTTSTWAVIGRQGAVGTMNISGGTFIHNGGGGDFEVGSGGANTAVLNLLGGTLRTNFIRNENGGGSQTINFNGGTLQSNNNDAGFIGGHAGFTRLNVEDNGAIIDTNGFNIGFSQGLVHSNIAGDAAIDGGLVKNGTGTFTLSASNSYNGPTVINAGNFTLSGALTATSGTTFNGGGVMTVSGNLASGPLAINGGSLLVTGNISSTGGVTMAAGTSLAGNGTVAGPLSIGSNSAITVGVSNAGTLNLTGGLALGGNTNISIGNISNYSSANTSAGIATGAYATNGGNVNFSVAAATGGLAVGNVFKLISYTSESGSAPTYGLNGALPARAIGTIADNHAGLVSLTINATDFLKWTGATSGTWDTATSNWKLNSNNSPTAYIDSPGDSVVFDDSATGTTTVSLGSAILHPNSVVFANATLPYTLSGTGGIAGLTGVTKTGTGTAFLNTSNTYAGATAIQNGTLAIGTGGSLNTSNAVVLGSGTTSGLLQVGDTNAVTLTVGSISTSGSGQANAVIGSNTGSTSAFNVSNTSPTVNTYTGFIGSGTAGATAANNLSLGKTGTGTLQLPGSNTYSGGTFIGGGTLEIGTGASLGTANINFTGNANIKADSNLTLSNNINIGTSSAVFDNNGNVLTLSGAILNTQNNQPILRPVGTGTNVISGLLAIAGENNQTNNPAIYMASTGNTTTITGTGSLNGISMAWLGTSNTLNLAPAGTLTFTNTDPSLDVGQQGGTGQVFQTTGTLNMAGNLSLGKWDSSYGTYTLSGGSLNAANIYSGGNGNGNGSSYFLQTGGNVTLTGQTQVGKNNAGSNVFVLNAPAGTYTNPGIFAVGAGGGNTASATISSGTLTIGSTINMGAGNTTTTTAVLNLNGGTTTASGIIPRGANSTKIVNFNGGTLKAGASTGDFLNGMTQANIYSGGAIIDTNGQNIGIGQNLSSAAASNGLNTPTVSIDSGGAGYVATPVVNITGGGGSGATAVATMSGGQVTGVTITNPGTGYTSTPTFSFVGGAATSNASAGSSYSPSANAADGGLIKNGAGNLTLSGSNTYNGNTQLNAGKIIVGSTNALGTGSAIMANGTALALTASSPVENLSGYNVNTNGIYFPSISASGNSVQLTNAKNSEATSIFSNNTFSINNSTGFVATYTYTHGNVTGQGGAADGVALVLSGAGNGGLGGSGGQLGYGGTTGVQQSVAAAVDVFLDQIFTGVNTAFNTGTGVNSVPFISTAGSSTVKVVYDGVAQTLTETITSNANGSSFSVTTPNIDLASIVGGSGGLGNAYIGFTAATGGVNDAQYVSNFSFSNTGTTLTSSAVAITNPIVVSPAAAATLELAPTAGYSSGSVGPISIANGGSLALSLGASPAAGVTRGVLSTPSITFANVSSGKLDVAANALTLSSQSLTTVQALIKSGYNSGAWNGNGLNSSAAASDSTHLTALGVMQNDQSGTPLYTASKLFSGIVPGTGDVLVKYTYYGDTNLDGTVDGTDYSRIDSGFITAATGWFNGDFNYDGKINGSDYTLIDNAYNTQGASLAAAIGGPTAQVTAQVSGQSASGGSSVPEPTSLGLLFIGAAGLLGRRRQR